MTLLGLAILIIITISTPFLYFLLRRREDGDEAGASAHGRGRDGEGNEGGAGETSGQLRELSERITALEEDVAVLKRRPRVEEDKETPNLLPPKQRPREPEPTANNFVLSESVEAFRKLYNDGVVNQWQRQDFRDTYAPIRIGTANSTARVREPKINPEFVTASDGDFYAVAVKERVGGDYLVVPRFDLIFQESIYGPGAMGVVFECRNYDPQARQTSMKLIRPATFTPDAGQSWTLRQKGILELTYAA